MIASTFKIAISKTLVMDFVRIPTSQKRPVIMFFYVRDTFYEDFRDVFALANVNSAAVLRVGQSLHWRWRWRWTLVVT